MLHDVCLSEVKNSLFFVRVRKFCQSSEGKFLCVNTKARGFARKNCRERKRERNSRTAKHKHKFFAAVFVLFFGGKNCH